MFTGPRDRDADIFRDIVLPPHLVVRHVGGSGLAWGGSRSLWWEGPEAPPRLWTAVHLDRCPCSEGRLAAYSSTLKSRGAGVMTGGTGVSLWGCPPDRAGQRPPPLSLQGLCDLRGSRSTWWGWPLMDGQQQHHGTLEGHLQRQSQVHSCQLGQGR